VRSLFQILFSFYLAPTHFGGKYLVHHLIKKGWLKLPIHSCFCASVCIRFYHQYHCNNKPNAETPSAPTTLPIIKCSLPVFINWNNEYSRQNLHNVCQCLSMLTDPPFDDNYQTDGREPKGSKCN